MQKPAGGKRNNHRFVFDYQLVIAISSGSSMNIKVDIDETSVYFVRTNLSVR